MTDNSNSKELTYKGVVKTIRFRNSENWSVFTIKDNEHPHDYINCTGMLPDIVDIDIGVEISGIKVDSKFGEQIKCSVVIPILPEINTAAGVVCLLQMLPGIGPKKAKQAVEDLGHELALRVAQECPSGLGITTFKMAEKAKEKAVLLSDRKATTATIYLLSIGLTDHQSAKIIKFYGAEDAVVNVQNNPYMLIVDIDGFGFLTVDKIAIKSGIALDNVSRVNACLIYCLTASEVNEGNIWINGKWLIKTCLDYLEDCAVKASVSLLSMPDYNMVRVCIYGLEEEGKITIDGIKVYSTKLLNAEKEIAEAAGYGIG